MIGSERNNLNKMLSWVFAAVAILLLALGCHEYESTASVISRVLTGAPTDETVWLIIGGMLAGITAVFGFPNDRFEKTQL